jgi:pimeloyl-ACP methyl ester carboxylesterase
VLSLLAAALAAQTYTSGPQVATFVSDADSSTQPYGLYVPKNLDPARKHPLVISLHGAFLSYRYNLRQVFGAGAYPEEIIAETSRYYPPLPDVDFLVAAPLARGDLGYQGLAEKDVYDVLADVQKRFPVDPDRVYLTGVSSGGAGALRLALTRPDVWAAVAAVCPTPSPATLELAPNATDLAVHLFHGDRDPLASVRISRQWLRTFEGLGVNVEYLEYPGVRHNAWDDAYRDGAIFDWFAQFRRNRFPERVRFLSRAYKYSSAYWVEIDGLTPGELASIDARFTAPNHIEVATVGVDGFTLELAGHPSYNAGHALAITVDGAVHKLKAGVQVSFSKVGAAWKPGRYQPAATSKRLGLEGPIAEALAARHLYVYGTADSPNDAELDRRRNQAATAAKWSTPRLRLLTSFRSVADRDVTTSDLESSNLVLFGTRLTNQLIARFTSHFPVELNPGAVVNSGLPWWTGAEPAAPITELPAGADFLFFRRLAANIITEGRFTRDWILPAAEAAKMLATGAVTLR